MFYSTYRAATVHYVGPLSGVLAKYCTLEPTAMTVSVDTNDRGSVPPESMGPLGFHTHSITTEHAMYFQCHFNPVGFTMFLNPGPGDTKGGTF